MLNPMRRALIYSVFVAGSATIALCAVCVTLSAAQGGKQSPTQAGIATAAGEVSPIYGVAVPAGYREWKLISIGRLKTDKLNQLRAQLGNDIAIKAFQEGKLPFPDGAMIAALHWTFVPSEANDKVLVAAFPGAQSFVPGAAVNVQFMVKDSKKYAATGGWGFADFKNGKPGDKALHEACFPCHEPAKDHDFVFAHYAPTP
jgi:Cytochrome P460